PAREATLKVYRESANDAETIPTLRVLTRALADMQAVGRQGEPALSAAVGPTSLVSLEESTSQMGSETVTTEALPCSPLPAAHHPQHAGRGAWHRPCAVYRRR